MFLDHVLQHPIARIGEDVKGVVALLEHVKHELRLFVLEHLLQCASNLIVPLQF